MNGDEGKGEMIEKKIPILEDTLNFGNLMAVKHGNGRDWWIILFKYRTNEYYRILLSPQGFKVFPTQAIGDTLKPSLSQTCFSPNGKKMGRNGLEIFGEKAEFDLYDFDRCSGLLSNHQRMSYIPGLKGTVVAGLSFSPNNKYAYTFSSYRAIQWDLTAKDIGESGDTIGYFDGYIENKVRALFYASQLAPDGKIYISSLRGPKLFHTVHQPNKKGALAQFQQRGFRLKSGNDGTIPNLPNFRLGPLDGSPCDTLGIDNIPISLFRFDQDTLNTASVEFSDLSYYEPKKWEWDFGDGTPKSYEQEPLHLFKKKGVYQVCLTVSNSNGKHTSCKKIDVATSVATKDELEKKQVNIYPNPAESTLSIKLETSDFINGNLQLLDIQGNNIAYYPLLPDHDEYRFDISNLQNGIYFWQLLLDDKVRQIGKIVVLK